MKMNLSDEVIAGLETKSRNYYVSDANIPGLLVYVRLSGTKALRENYASPKYHFKKTVTLGAFGDVTYKEAREKAIEIRAKLNTCKNKDEADQVAKEYKQEKPKVRMSWIDSARSRLSAQIRESAIPRPHVNMLFQDGSEVMHDFAWPELWVAVNLCVGYVYAKKSINAVSVILEKHNLARTLGWSVYLVSQDMVNNGSAIELISRAIKSAIEEQEKGVNNGH